MPFKKIVKTVLSKLNLSTYGNVEKKKIEIILNLLKPYNLGYEFTRIGGSKDGSYILPNTLEEIKYCFSAGYGGHASFEKDLESYNIKSFLADFSYAAPKDLKNFHYDKKFIKSFNDEKSIDVNYWIEKSVPESEKNMILQVDVEGSEYEVLHAISEKNLKRFKIFVIELHHLHMINNQIFYKYFYSCIKKIKKFYEVFYINPNNCCGVTNFQGIIFPNILEITFLNKELVKTKDKFIKIPDNLKIKNIEEKNEILLPDYWY